MGTPFSPNSSEDLRSDADQSQIIRRIYPPSGFGTPANQASATLDIDISQSFKLGRCLLKLFAQNKNHMSETGWTDQL